MRDRRRIFGTVVASLVALIVPRVAPAQIRASELASVSQVIDGTRIDIAYSRPRLRGRAQVFGTKYVTWGETWTPGANWASTLQTNRNVKLNGHAVPAGKYSMWMVVRQQGDWTLVLDPDWHRFHENRPDSNAKQIRLPVRVEAAPPTEVLTWSVPAVRINGGTLVMQWSDRRVGLDLEVEPSLPPETSAEVAGAYLGRYTFTWTDASYNDRPRTFSISHEDGVLRGRFDVGGDGFYDWFGSPALIRVADDWFAPGLYDEHGQIYEVLRPDMTFEFTRDTAGRVASFVVRDDSDTVIATGTRQP